MVFVIAFGILLGYVLIKIAKYIQTKYKNKQIDYRQLFKITTIVLVLIEFVNAACLDYRDQLPANIEGPLVVFAIPAALILWMVFARRQGKLKITPALKQDAKEILKPIGAMLCVGLFMILLTLIFENRPKHKKIRISYTEYYAYCIKSVGNTENMLIKQSSGVDFCDCIANQMVSQEYINEHSLKAAGEAAAAVCTNKIDKILSAKGL